MHKIEPAQGIDSFSCNVVFTIFMWSSSQKLSRRFVGFNDACIFCLANARKPTGVPVLASPDLARHGCSHRSIQLFPRVLKGFRELTSQFSSILTHFWPASTLLRGHLALATLSPLVNDPQILERWGYADEVHLGEYIRAKDFGLEF